MSNRVFIYDTTLRDGTQAEGISYSVADKIRIAEKLDEFGIDYLEGGWPGSNPITVEFFKAARKRKWKNLKLAAFGSTRHAKNTAAKDPNLRSLIESETPVTTIFGKSWDFHVKKALRVSLDDNLDMIADSVRYLKSKGKEVIYDAEHFFDGFYANQEYALATLAAAEKAGADCLVLCETNGGKLPFEIMEVMSEVLKHVKAPLGIHTHNDSACATANSLMALAMGAVHVQGTMNGIGERCGNADLIEIIPNLELKMGRKTVGKTNLKKLTELSRFMWEISNMHPRENAPFVGGSAFAHKAGIHVSAVMKDPETYEHTSPEAVGNHRRVLVSDQSGRSNLLYKAEEMGMRDLDPGVMGDIIRELKEMEHSGYQFEGAEASFEMLVHRAHGRTVDHFELESFRVINEKRGGNPVYVEATVKAMVKGQEHLTVAEGNGPVNAIDAALRKALLPFYPRLKDMSLVDYKVRVLEESEGTAAGVRVLILSTDGHETWGTVGVSVNIIEASYLALVDSINYFLFKIAKNGRKGGRAKIKPRAPKG